jgi:Ca2+-binding EF-hand superfamily protein
MGEMAPTGLDAVTLKDLYGAFADFASEEALDIGAFTGCLQRMGIGMPALAERLFHAFDYAKVGRLDFRAFATGMSLICNDASAADRLELTFNILTNNTAVGLISAAELKSLVREFLWGAMDVVQGLMDTTSVLFHPGGGDEVGETADARRTVEAAAAAQVDRVADAITQEAVAAGGLAGRDLAEGRASVARSSDAGQRRSHACSHGWRTWGNSGAWLWQNRQLTLRAPQQLQSRMAANPAWAPVSMSTGCGRLCLGSRTGRSMRSRH